jgi:DNA-binding CsgD family transcriptional regulator
MTMSSEPVARAIRPTPIELVILEYLAQDYTNSQIGKRIRRSEQTVKTHIRRLIALTRVNSRTGLAVTFIQWRDLGIPNQYWDEPKDVYSQMGRGKNGHAPEG